MTGMTDKKLFIEETLLNSVKNLLSGRVNELLGEREHPILPVEFGRSVSGDYAVTPVLRLSTCERSEKERIVRLDAYTMTITLNVPEHPEGERFCYAYAWAVATALEEDPTLGGVANRTVLTGKKYNPPKTPHCGEGWEVILMLRIVVEGVGNGN
jgi:hypothetical protein